MLTVIDITKAGTSSHETSAEVRQPLVRRAATFRKLPKVKHEINRVACLAFALCHAAWCVPQFYAV